MATLLGISAVVGYADFLVQAPWLARTYRVLLLVTVVAGGPLAALTLAMSGEVKKSFGLRLACSCWLVAFFLPILLTWLPLPKSAYTWRLLPMLLSFVPTLMLLWSFARGVGKALRNEWGYFLINLGDNERDRLRSKA